MKTVEHYKITVELIAPVAESERYNGSNGVTIYEQRAIELDLTAVIDAVNKPPTVEQLAARVEL